MALSAFDFDTFVDANGVLLENHTGEVGASWSQHPTSATTLEIQSNRLERTTQALAVYLASGTPPSPDYSVEVTMTRVALAGGVFPGVIGRADSVANTLYQFRYETNSDNFRMFKIVAGITTELGTPFVDVVPEGGSRKIRLQMEGDQIRGFVDGVLRVFDTDTDIAAAGSSGIRFAGTGGVWAMDNFRAATFGDISAHLTRQLQAIRDAIVARLANIDAHVETVPPTRQDMSVRLLAAYRDALAARAA